MIIRYNVTFIGNIIKDDSSLIDASQSCCITDDSSDNKRSLLLVSDVDKNNSRFSIFQ